MYLQVIEEEERV